MAHKRKDSMRQLRDLTERQLSDRISDNRKKLVLIEQDRTLGKVKNVHETTILRKEVARALTILDEKVSQTLK